MKKILDGRAFAQEFRIGGHAELESEPRGRKPPGRGATARRSAPARCSFRSPVWSARDRGNLPRDIVNGGKIGFARLQRRRANADEDGVGSLTASAAIRW